MNDQFFMKMFIPILWAILLSACVQSTEQTELVLKILLYAGVVVKSPEIVQVAAQQVAQENINQQR